MNLHNKIKLVDDLIREDSNATVKDFVEIITEIQEIEIKTFVYEIPILCYDTGHD